MQRLQAESRLIRETLFTVKFNITSLLILHVTATTSKTVGHLSFQAASWTRKLIMTIEQLFYDVFKRLTKERKIFKRLKTVRGNC